MSSTDPVSYIGAGVSDTIFIDPVNEDEVTQLINGLKHSSAGWDNLSSSVMKRTYMAFISPLTHVFNLSLSQGVFPSELKVAKVIPLYKSGESTLFTNYRPISILYVKC